MRQWIPIVWMAAVAAAAGVVLAQGDFQAGLWAYERGDYEQALEQWLPLAEENDAEAQYRVGRLYYYGRGVETDYEQAARWYLAAAEQGHARSQSNVAIMYEQGRGLPADIEQAVRWYRLAAEQDRAVSQCNLGRLYEQGRGVPRDESRAASLYEAAARQGHAEAQYRLATLYRDGRGVEADPKAARTWFRRAEKNGYLPTPSPPVAGPAALEQPDEDEEPSVSEPAEPAPATPAVAVTGDLEAGREAYERKDYDAAAREWRPLAEAGDAEAQYWLGTLYRLGQGTQEDRAEAGRWYLRAAEQGHELAMYHLAFMYYRGQGVSRRRDYVGGYVWFSLAAEAEVGDAAAWRDELRRKMTPDELAEAEAGIAAQKKKRDRPAADPVP
jgi:TPR repeat protein